MDSQMNGVKADMEMFWYTMGNVAVAVVVLFELYQMFQPSILTFQRSAISFTVSCVRKPNVWYSTVRAILQDYQSGKFYKPWKSRQMVIIVDNKKHIMELSEASELSQRAVYADMFGFKHTMNGLDHNAHMIARSRLYGRLLQVRGRGNLAAIFSSLKRRLDETMNRQLELLEPAADGFVPVPVASTVRDCASKLMSLIFFGENISSDPRFASALLRYPKDMVTNMAAFQITPSFLSTTIHAIITNRGAAMRTILGQLELAMGKGRDSWDESEDIKNHTIMDNMTKLTEQTRDYWTPEVLAQSLLGIWFAASHQPWMNLDFVMLELCYHPEYIQLLRDEIGDYSDLNYEQLEDLPILDSFIKETVRLNPLDTRAIRRKALKPFTFSGDGPHVPTGSIACVSSVDMMHDRNSYPEPYKFNGHRFISCASSMRNTRFTDVSENFPVWGYGSLACPGRFHASLVMKLTAAYLITHFDMRLEAENARVRWMWETFTMPYEKTRILLRKRVC